MRKIFISVAMSVMTLTTIGAQSITDAIRYGDNAIMGTARYMGMAGSFGALGGDPSAIIDNPAALGVYRSSEVAFTLNPTITSTVMPMGKRGAKSNDFFFNFNQASFVLALPSGRDKGYISSNFSFNYNRLKDFHRTVDYYDNSRSSSLGNVFADMANGFYYDEIHEDNEYVPYLAVMGYETFMIDPLIDTETGDTLDLFAPYSNTADVSLYNAIESGRIDEYNFSYGMNINHTVYIGLGLGIQTLNYNMISSSGEKYENAGFTPTMLLDNSFSANGTGANFRAGVIVRAASFLRLGASIQTPTYYRINEVYSGNLETNGIEPSGGYASIRLNSHDYYKYSSPLRFQASAAFIIGKSALINVDYQLADFKNMKFEDTEDRGNILTGPAFAHENSYIKEYGRLSHTVKIGGEYRIASTYSLRAGFAYQTANVSPYATRSMIDNTTRMDLDYYLDRGSIYGSIGFGYRYNGFGIDIAYLYRNKSEAFATYQKDAVINNGYYEVPADASKTVRTMADFTTHAHNVAMTLSFKF